MTRQKWKEADIDKGQLRKTWSGVFDNRTVLNIHKLMSKGEIVELRSMLKEGKESKVLSGIGREGKEIAIKIYAVEAANFTKMQQYITGDPRFRGIKKDKYSVIKAWAQKEYKNLQRATEAGIDCPKPHAVENNVLVMSLIGENNRSAPRVTDIEIPSPEYHFWKIVENMTKLWKKAQIVHGDLSEYNMLFWENKIWFIDFSQSVVVDHLMSVDFLKRDIHNICKYFSKLGVESDEYKIYKMVTGK